MDSSSSDEDSPELETLDISNDTYYKVIPSARLKDSIHEDFKEVPVYGSPAIRHSLAAYDLWRPFFPSHLTQEGLLKFHRPQLRHYKVGPQAWKRTGRLKPFPIKNLSREIYRSQKDLRNRIVRAINSGMCREEIVNKILQIRRAKDLTAKRGELFLFEYCEEHPPVLSQIGMASTVKTYTQSSDGKPQNNNNTSNNNGSQQRLSVLAKSNRDNINSPHTTTSNILEATSANQNISSLRSGPSIGTREVLSDSKQTKPLYFSALKPGTETMFIENNLYRAPIYPHQMDDCDFLVIRTRNNIYVRTFQKIFTVGQMMPLDIIPPPTEKAISKFRSDLLNRHIHRLFRESDSKSHQPGAIDLEDLHKMFPDYARSSIQRRMTLSGVKNIGDGLFHRNTSEYGLKPLKQERSFILPEQYCLSMSMLVSRQRLRELYYSETMILQIDNAELETEVLAAPWNTSKAINDSMMGRCYLDFKQHLIDPTGPQREGFSCVSWAKSKLEEEQKNTEKKTKGSSHTQPASIPSTNPLAFKIKKEKLERLAIYQKEAQLITSLQANILGSHEPLSSDEGSDGEVSDGEQESVDKSLSQQARDLDKLVVEGRTSEELNFEKEEEERRGLMSMLNDTSGDQPTTKENSEDGQPNAVKYKNKVLVITRTYENEAGVKEVKTELVRQPDIIDRYMKTKVENAPSPQDHELITSAMQTPETTASPLANRNNLDLSSRRSSLGPSELSRTDGMVLIINKSALPKNRHPRRSSQGSRSHAFYH